MVTSLLELEPLGISTRINVSADDGLRQDTGRKRTMTEQVKTPSRGPSGRRKGLTYIGLRRNQFSLITIEDYLKMSRHKTDDDQSSRTLNQGPEYGSLRNRGGLFPAVGPEVR